MRKDFTPLMPNSSSRSWLLILGATIPAANSSGAPRRYRDRRRRPDNGKPHAMRARRALPMTDVLSGQHLPVHTFAHAELITANCSLDVDGKNVWSGKCCVERSMRMREQC